MTPCHRDHNDILEYADGGLDPLKEKEIGGHVEKCCDCARLLHKIRLQRNSLRGLTPLQTRDNFNVLLHERIRREMAGKRGLLFRPILERRWIPASAVAVAVLAVGAWMLNRRAVAPPAAAPASEIAVTAPDSAPKTAVPAARERVHYVIDEYPRAAVREAPADSADGAMLADTAGRIRNVDALRGRLTPVSF
jgi:anti-sigma factor RsiW